MSTDESGDDDPTPTVEPLTRDAINLLDLALATESVAVNCREAARQLSGASDVARKLLLAELGIRLTQIGGVFVEAGQALKEESHGERA